MALIWKNNDNVAKIETVIKGKSPRAFVEKVEKWCPYINAETSGYKKRLIKKLNKIEVKKIIDILEQNQNVQFTIKDLINWQNANYLTDGSLQRKVLGILVCNGIVKKEIIPYTNKKGDELFYCKYKFISREGKICPYINDKEKCGFDWKIAEETRYFTEPEIKE